MCVLGDLRTGVMGSGGARSDDADGLSAGMQRTPLRLPQMFGVIY